jgi:cell wall-associated NlpC family hydrolase
MVPGFSSLGSSAAGTERAGFGGGSAGNNGFNFDLSGLTALETKLKDVVAQLSTIDSKFSSIAGKIGSVGGISTGAAAGSKNTVAAFAAPPGQPNVSSSVGAAMQRATGAATGSAAGAGGANPNTPGPGGPSNTSAGFGSVGTMLAGVAGAGAIAGAYNKVSGWLGSMQQGGVPVQLASAMQATITGGSGYGNTQAWNGVSKTSQADMAAAQNMAMQNPYLSVINPQSKNFNNMKGFLNATQKLGGVSATSAMGMLNDLTTNQATSFFAARSGGHSGPLDPKTGKLRSPQQALLSTLQAATGTVGQTGKTLSDNLKSISSRGGQWQVVSNNLEQGAGLSSSDMVILHELAAQGGNLGKAQGGQVSKTLAMQLLSQTTQKTNTQNTLFQATSGLQTAFSKLSTTVSHFEQQLTNVLSGGAHGLPGLLSHIPGVGGVLGGAVSHIPGLSSIPGLGDPPTGSTSTSGMQPNLAHGITAMKAANPNLRINSGHRSTSQQAALYAMKGGKGVSRPGQSPHQLGKAADIGPPSQYAWVAANAGKYGLATDRHEPWHVQAMGDPSSAATVTGAQVVSKASSQLGVNYVWGGETAGKAFDCSGLVQWVFAQVGINLPRTSQQQAGVGTPVKGLNSAQAGDIILYNEPGEGPNSHVAIYIGGGKQIAAPHTGTVVQVQGVDTANISTIRRVVGGGAGGKVAAAAQGAVGNASNDSANHSGGAASKASGATGGGLGNSFVAGLSSHSLFGGSAGAGGGNTNPNTGNTSNASAAAPSGGGPATGATGSTTIPSTGTLTPAQVEAAWVKAGGPANVAKTMAGIAMAESSDEPGIVQKGEPYSATGWGLWQITPGNSESQVGVDNALLDPVTNAKAALAKYRGAGNTLRPWQGDHYLTGNNINPNSSGVGDPVGGFQPAMASQAMNGPGPVSTMQSGGARGISVTVGPIYVNGTQADANNIANMVASAIKGNKEIQAVTSS